MTASAAYLGTMKATGTAVPVTAEPCGLISGSDPNKLYQVTSSSRRIWDPTAAITVKDAGTPVSAALYTFDYLFGFVQFVGHSVTGAITVDGSYLPTIAVAEVRKYGLKLTSDQLDKTSFDTASGWRTFLQGLKNGSVDFEMLGLIAAPFDSNVGGLLTLLENSTPKVLELGGAGRFFRIWCVPETLGQAADVGALVVGSMSWKQSAPAAGVGASYGS